MPGIQKEQKEQEKKPFELIELGLNLTRGALAGADRLGRLQLYVRILHVQATDAQIGLVLGGIRLRMNAPSPSQDHLFINRSMRAHPPETKTTATLGTGISHNTTYVLFMTIL